MLAGFTRPRPRQLRSAHSLDYTVSIAPGTEVDFSYLAPGFRCIKLSWGMEMRSDGNGKQIVLMHLTKNYIVGKEEQSEVPDLMEQFKSLPASAHESLDEQTVDGRKLLGYRVHPSKSEMPGAVFGRSTLDLWVDAATGNPDHVDLSIQEHGKPLYQMHIKNIRIDAQIDRSFFDMNPPAGYTNVWTPETAEHKAEPLSVQRALRPEIKQASALTAVVLPMQGSFTQARSGDDPVPKQLERSLRNSRRSA